MKFLFHHSIFLFGIVQGKGEGSGQIEECFTAEGNLEGKKSPPILWTPFREREKVRKG